MGEISTIKIKDSEALVTKLKLQLSYDNLNMVKFFKILIDSYLNRDQRMLEILQEKNTRNTKRSKRLKDERETKKTINDFALDDNDVEDIFDLIAKENPEL